MRKTIIIIIAILVVIGLAFVYIKSEVHTGVASQRQEDALAVSEANVGQARKAKVQGESATKRADKAKQERTSEINQLKEEMRGQASSYDDIPLSHSDIIILCRAYRSTDTVCSASDKSD